MSRHSPIDASVLSDAILALNAPDGGPFSQRMLAALRKLISTDINAYNEFGAAGEAFIFKRLVIFKKKAAVAIIQKPLRLTAFLDHPIRNAIRFEMIFLRFIHGNEQVSGFKRERQH